MTKLNLLERDGAISVRLTAELSPVQYEQLHNVVVSSDHSSTRSLICRLAQSWGVPVVIEPLLVLSR